MFFLLFPLKIKENPAKKQDFLLKAVHKKNQAV